MRLSEANVGHLRSASPLAVLLLVGLLLVGCLPGAGRVEPSGTGPGGTQAASPKVLRLGLLAYRQLKDSVIAMQGSTGGEYMYVFHSGLTVYDAQDKLLPRLAQKVPTVSDGDWKVLPDGQMEVTWKLRPNVKWQDGVPATSGDFAFGMKVIQDPDFPLARPDAARLVLEVVTPDPSTLVVRWKQTYVFGNASGPADISALPRHLMSDLYERGDKQAFFNSPLWAREWVGLGPYRLGEWVEGSRLEGLAFDDYFLGRPKIDRVGFQYIGDPRGIVLSFLSGTSDVTPYGSVSLPQLLDLKKTWEPAGNGTTFANYAGTRAYSFQFRNTDVPWADVRVRRALAHMVDRQVLVDTLMDGLSSVPDTVVSPTDPIYPLLERRGLARYPFDLAQAQQLMADSGWTRPPGGVYRSSTGQPFTMDIAFSDQPVNATEAEAVAGQWKAVGLPDVTFTPIPDLAPTAVRNEMRHTFTGTQAIQARDDIRAMNYIRSEIGTADNRYIGGNRGGYSNPEFDRLYDRAIVTLDEPQRLGLMADFLKLLADDVAMIHLFYDPGQASGAVRTGIRGPGPAGSSKQLITTWNIDEWDMD